MKISIATPTLEPGPMLSLAHASVCDQDGVEWEHLIQSTRDTTQAQAWGAKHPTACLHCEPDKNLYDAVNRAWAKSTGDILGHLNEDEQYLPGTLAMVARWFQNHPAVDVLFADVIMVDPGGHALCYRRAMMPSERHSRFRPLSVFTAGTFFRRRILERGFRYPTEYRIIGDAVWVNRLCRARVTMRTLASPVASYTISGVNLGESPLRVEEQERFIGEVGSVSTWRRHAVLWSYRTRRLLAGAARRRSLEYALYTSHNTTQRHRFSEADVTGLYPPRARYRDFLGELPLIRSLNFRRRP